MGKAVKKVLPVALGVAGAYFGFTALQAGIGAAGSGTVGPWGSRFLAGAGVKDTLGLALGFAGAAGSFQTANLTAEAIEFEKMQAKQEAQIAELSGKQHVLAIADERRRLRNNSIAQAAGQNKDVRSSRSFQVYLQDIDDRAAFDTKNSLISARAGVRSSNLELAELGSAQRTAYTSGFFGAARSLLKTTVS